MKTLIVSDTHLGLHFDHKKYNFLKKIISSTDRVIINGDFWEGYETSFEKFINSKWKFLFPLLLKKKTVYIFGNHDKKSYSDKNVAMFSVHQALQYSFTSGGLTFQVEHGDRIAPLWDKYFSRTPGSIIKALELVEYLLTRNFNRKLLYKFYEKSRKKMKKYAQKTLKKNEWFITGHIPFPEIDTAIRYANSGFCKYGVGQYLLIQNGKIIAKEEWYDR